MSVPSPDPLSRCFINRDSIDSGLEEHWTLPFSCLARLLSPTLGTYCLLCVPPCELLFILAALIAAFTTFSCSYLYLRSRNTTMLISTVFGLLATVLLSAPPVLAIDKPVNPDLSAKLKMAITHLDFWNTLSDNDFVFDFTKQSETPYQPGSVLNANVATWPLLIYGNQAVSQLNFGPCAMLSPHNHPHATNIVVSVAGSVRTYMRAENGAIDRQTVLTPGKMTMFPKASMHSMVNEACTNAQLYSFLDSSDPGTLNFAQAMWSVGEDILTQVMPMIDQNGNDWNTTGQRIPDVGTGSQEGYRACRERCGIA